MQILKTLLCIANNRIFEEWIGANKIFIGVDESMCALQVREPHPDIGCWWTLYDYGLDSVKTWAKDYKREYPGKTWNKCSTIPLKFVKFKTT